MEVTVIICTLKELGTSLHGDIADIGAAVETVRMLPLPPEVKQMFLDYMADIMFACIVSELECKLTLSYGTKSGSLGTCYDNYWQNVTRRTYFSVLNDVFVMMHVHACIMIV